MPVATGRICISIRVFPTVSRRNAMRTRSVEEMLQKLKLAQAHRSELLRVETQTTRSSHPKTPSPMISRMSRGGGGEFFLSWLSKGSSRSA